MSTFWSILKSASPFLSTFLSAVIFFSSFFSTFFPLSEDPNLYAILRRPVSYESLYSPPPPNKRLAFRIWRAVQIYKLQRQQVNFFCFCPHFIQKKSSTIIFNSDDVPVFERRCGSLSDRREILPGDCLSPPPPTPLAPSPPPPTPPTTSAPHPLLLLLLLSSFSR